MAILLNSHGDDNASWIEALSELLPEQEIFEFPNIPGMEDIEYAVIWHHPHGDLLRYPNLKAVLILGAGTDYIDLEPKLPGAPIIRLIDPDVGNDMAQYACYSAMHFHRQYELYSRQQAQKEWQRCEMPRSEEFGVTVLGLGQIGKFIAQRISVNGFKAQARSRSQHSVDGVDCYSAERGFAEVLAKSDVLINCLPLNEDTENFLDANSLALLP